jgi:protein phosphatase
MKTITLNSVIFLIDLHPDKISNAFQPHEILTPNKILVDLLGYAPERHEMTDAVSSEMERRMMSKLALGERVVISDPHLKRNTRINMAKEAQNRGFNVFYLIGDLSKRPDLMGGDRIAEVIDFTVGAYNIVKLLPDQDFFANLRARGYSGITAIPDIHGNLNALRNAVSWARGRNHFVLLLGDLLDYGIDSLEVIEVVYQMVIRGEAEVIMGNHERKIFRYLNQPDKHVKLSEGNKVTINRVKGLSKFDYNRWVSRFNAMFHLMRHHRSSDGFVFTHGAAHPDLFDITAKRLPGALESMCLFGETDNSVKRDDGYPNRVYNWVDKLTENQIAIVGHDIRSTFEPLTQIGTEGGTAIFMDTGCSKGGHLSTVDIRFTDTTAKVGNFNLH